MLIDPPNIDINKSLKDAALSLNKTGKGIVIVTEDNKFSGIVTDGDIRRGSKNYSDKTKITSLMTKKPLFVGENVSAEKALSIMSDKKITSLIVSSDLDYKKRRAIFKPKGILHIHSLLKYGMR